jgi:hypothetical protein
MKLKSKLFLGSAVLAAVLLSAPFSGAQQKQTPAAQANISYDLSRETLLQGTVISFTPAATTPPIGAHVSIQTASGPVDVHLGNPGVLKASDIFLSAGDSVRIVGESLRYAGGTFFAARILQKGTQSVTLRNLRGIPLSPGRPKSVSAPRSPRGGAQ